MWSHADGLRPPSGQLGQLMAAIYPGEVKPPVAVLAAYFDDSPNGPICAIAGYVGVVDQLDRGFAPAWASRVLDASPRPISEFKACDCRHRQGEFSGWTRDECDDLTKRAVDVITDHSVAGSLFGVGAAFLINGQFSDPNHPQLTREQIGLVWAVAHAINHAFALFEDRSLEADRIELIFDNQEGLKRTIRIVHQILLMDFPPERAAKISEPIFRDSRQIIPLQAADLLAYETYKELKSRLEVPARPPSRALERLVQGRSHSGIFVDGLLVESMVKQDRHLAKSERLRPKTLYQTGLGVRVAGLDEF